MKRILFTLLALTGIAVTSCQKCTVCECTTTTEWSFEEGFDEDVENSIRSQYEKEFDEDYPAILEEEICTKRGQHSDTIAAFEEMSYFFSEDDNVQGSDWSVDFNRSCTCED